VNRRVPSWLTTSEEVAAALRDGVAVVALESAVISHGLPAPQAVWLAGRLDAAVRATGAVPALVTVRAGRVVAGADPSDLAYLLKPSTVKIAERDLAVATALGQSGGTTVSGTLAVASDAGIGVVATGGIGGVHRGADVSGDISADLAALARRPLVVVCAGPKAFCDPALTLEALDALGVTVVGCGTDTLPAFLAPSTGVALPHRIDRPEDLARVARAKRRMRDRAALLVVQPPPAGAALTEEELQAALTAAIERARDQCIVGAALTPFLLGVVAERTEGRSLAANLAVLEANARLAAEIAVAITGLAD
jgi:pseudouridine-5'-phosphate glycosidase